MQDYKSNNEIIQKLHEGGFLSDNELAKIMEYKEKSIFSLFYELRILLYVSITLITGAVGILIYDHIGVVGHVALISLILLTSAFCFYKAVQIKHLNASATVHSVWLNYGVLVANLLLGIVIAYIQFQFEIFGTYYQIATLIAAGLYLFSAFYFDHKGVLSLGISAVAATVGLSLKPKDMYEYLENDNIYLSYAGVLLGMVLIAWKYVSDRFKIRIHFNVVYLNFALHLISIFTLSTFDSSYWIISLLVLILCLWFYYRISQKALSINYILFIFLYGFIALNILFFKLPFQLDGIFFIIYLAPLLYGFSIYFFISYLRAFKKKMKDAGIQ